METKITLSLLEVQVIEGSSYQGLGLVNVTVNVEGNPGEIDVGSS